MNELLEKTRKAVEKYHSKHGADRLKATRNVLAAVLECRKYVSKNESEDSDLPLCFARELSTTLSALPLFRKFASEKDSLENIQDKKVADEHLEKIQKELENGVKELEESKRKRIRDWTRSHPVFSKLVKSASKRYPEGTYVLLFRRSGAAPRRAKKHKSESGNFDKAELAELQAHTAARSSEPELEQGVALESVTLVESGVEQALAASAAPEACTREEHAEMPATKTEGTSTCCLQNAEEHVEQGTAVVELMPSPEPAETEGHADECRSETACKTVSSQASPGCAPAQEDTLKQPVATPAQEGVPPELVIRPSADGKVFTRFRPKEFSDETRIYRLFRTGVPIVGACIISNGKLELAIGELPKPVEGGDQLRLLLSLSKEAVAKPGKAFLESQPVLNELFRMAKNREIDKDSYILLFQAKGRSKEPGQEESLKKKHDESHEQQSQADRGLEIQTEIKPELEPTAENAAPDLEKMAEADMEVQPAEPSPEAEESGQELGEEMMEAESHEEVHSLDDESESEDEDGGNDELELELISKQTEDGRTITRFRSFDFNDSRSIFEYFKKRKPVRGAAVIKERELLKVVGEVPQPGEGESQLHVLEKFSREAVDKPAIDFIATNSVLHGIFELACKESRQSELSVVLFTEEAGRLSILSLPDKRGRRHSKSPLSDFRAARILHERFKDGLNLVGASVITGHSAGGRPFEREREREQPKGGKDRDRKDSRDARPKPGLSQKPPVVVAAFGRTPLKQNVLLSPDILKRLGVDLSILY